MPTLLCYALAFLCLCLAVRAWSNTGKLRAENQELRHHLHRLAPNTNLTLLNGNLLSLQKIFQDALLPALLVSPKGEIVWSNPAFWKLVGRQQIRSLADFDKVAGCFIERVMDRKHSHTPTTLNLRVHGQPNEWLRYEAYHWPVPLKLTTHTLILLSEQDHHASHHQVKTQFQHQLIRYLRSIASDLTDFGHRSKQQTDPKMKALTEEVNLLGEYLEKTQLQIGHSELADRVDLGRLTNFCVNTLRQTYSAKKLHLICTLPYKSYIHGHLEDYKLSLNTLLDAIMSVAGPNQTIRIDLVRKPEGKILLQIVLPDIVLEPLILKQILHFGAKDQALTTQERFWRLQISLVKQIISRYKAELSVCAEANLGTVFSLSCTAFEQE